MVILVTNSCHGHYSWVIIIHNISHKTKLDTESNIIAWSKKVCPNNAIVARHSKCYENLIGLIKSSQL